MKPSASRLAVSTAFALIIAYSVFQNGRGFVVSAGAGLMAGALYYFISRVIQN